MHVTLLCPNCSATRCFDMLELTEMSTNYHCDYCDTASMLTDWHSPTPKKGELNELLPVLADISSRLV